MVFLNSAIFIVFACSFFRPKTKRDWGSFGGFSAFIIALFAEMYGFPLTIYLLSGWLTTKYPKVDFSSHENGHLLHTIFGFDGNPHYDPFHILSFIIIFIGFMLIARAWRVLHEAHNDKRLATTGLYSLVRHPQYVGFILIMFGFLLQWPTLLTLVMFPVLVIMYLRLAKKEEDEVAQDFFEEYKEYSINTPAFIPKFASLKEYFLNN